MTFADDADESGRDEEAGADAEAPETPAEAPETPAEAPETPAEETAADPEPEASAKEGTESETVAESGDVADSPAEPAAEEVVEESSEADEGPAAGDQPAAEEPPADDQSDVDVPVADEAPAAEKPAEPAKAEKSKDVVPGADLEPIAINEERELTTEERARAEAEAEERAAREARTAAEDDDEEVAPRTVTVPGDAQIQATGKRKSAVARVIVRSGSGGFQVNDRSLEEYFPSSLHQSQARQALVSSGYDGAVDVSVRVHGGGISGQAGAVRHGVARALTSLEPELRGDLKRRGMLTRDDRRKERKKAGLKKARKRPQFSKR